MTLDEKLRLIFGFSDGATTGLANVPDDIVSPALKAYVIAHQIRGAAGFVPGVPRLGIPDQTQTDASMGVRNSFIPATALPSSLTTAASFDPAVSSAGGAMIAAEARATGHNTLLAGGANLAREPRNGRNFEYAGEDPLLAGVMTGSMVRSIQSMHMISTLKHFAVNSQETQRTTIDATISASAMRQSDLLAFEIAYEIGRPASVMCAYNLVNGTWACENDYLLNKVLKGDWGFKGFVMSDWGAVHSTAGAANRGLDQFTGYCCIKDFPHFAAKPFKEAMAAGAIPSSRLDDMATRILWAMYSTGVIDFAPAPAKIDYAEHARVAQRTAEESLVLLKNDGDLLPLRKARSIAVIGGKADKSVMAGGGSSAVTPIGISSAEMNRTPFIRLPSSPYDALKRELPHARISYEAGENIPDAVALARQADVAIVFVTKVASEGNDSTLDLSAPQNALVEAVLKANPRTVVVVESGGAVLMPWADCVPAILEAFYPGIRGGEAIARILTGKVNPSGHLPITFPASNDQLAHPVIAGWNKRSGLPAEVTYFEGAAIGYKWFDAKGMKPLFAFGRGLSYTHFVVSAPSASLDGDTLNVRFTLRNTGKVAGKGVAQVYVSPADWRQAGWEAPKRLGNFAKIMLKPGQSQTVALAIDPRLLATYEAAGNNWVIKAGVYRLALGQAADDLPEEADVILPERRWSAALGTP
jgi:beta-glucosidase